MSAEAQPSELVKVVALLGAAVVMVPIFRRLGLGSVLGYLAAGLLIGPFGLRWFSDPHAILHVAELGVVMFLFLIGLEMRPAHLWSLRRQIFGLGSLQIALCTIALTCVLRAFALPWQTAFIGAAGFVLTSTAVVMQLLAERGDMALPRGQKIVAILLFEDLLIVPLLASVALMAPQATAPSPQGGAHWHTILIALGALAMLLALGRYVLNPMFRILAAGRAREVMTAAALLVVLGAALLMEKGGLSAAMGAFVAGVMLSGSTFRHQIEADIEPFRGLLLGLFFLGVGMSLDLSVVAANWLLIGSGVVAMMLAKALCIYIAARLTKSARREALDRAVLMAQGGEFAFVLFASATGLGVIDAQANANLTAIVVLSMALTPLAVLAFKKLMPAETKSMEGIEAAHGLSGSVLVIGFGRFGQVASQALLARDVEVTIIDTDVDMIRSATGFGFRVYYGDGTRLDVLHASGAANVRAILVCIDQRDAANKIVELVKHSFPHAKVLVRAFDREHALELVAAGVDAQIRETFHSAVAFGEAALREIGVDAEEAASIASEVRKLDAERFKLEQAGGIRAGIGLMRKNIPLATPLIKPQREAEELNLEAEAAAQSTIQTLPNKTPATE